MAYNFSNLLIQNFFLPDVHKYSKTTIDKVFFIESFVKYRLTGFWDVLAFEVTSVPEFEVN